MQIETDRIDNRRSELQRHVITEALNESNECSVLGKDAMKPDGAVILKWSFFPDNF
jgi:hypothetical protein